MLEVSNVNLEVSLAVVRLLRIFHLGVVAYSQYLDRLIGHSCGSLENSISGLGCLIREGGRKVVQYALIAHLDHDAIFRRPLEMRVRT